MEKVRAGGNSLHGGIETENALNTLSPGGSDVEKG
jgi:hypothetical protein